MVNIELLKVYQFNNKIRCGVNCDGGYVFGELGEEYDCYISAGISNEESFSRDFIEKYKTTNNFGFDGTIRDYPYQYTRDITFIKKNINSYNDDNNTDLSFLTESYNNIFLKIDIEGGEYPWILSLNDSKINKFKQIVIEFHGITNDGWGCQNSIKDICLQKLNNTHYLIHAHGNNHGPSSGGIPDVIELTYVNKSYFKDVPEFNKISLPIPGMDFPNNQNLPDINLNNFPFKQISI